MQGHPTHAIVTASSAIGRIFLWPMAERGSRPTHTIGPGWRGGAFDNQAANGERKGRAGIATPHPGPQKEVAQGGARNDCCRSEGFAATQVDCVTPHVSRRVGVRVLPERETGGRRTGQSTGPRPP